MLDQHNQEPFTDENYACEIMQLFTVGLVLLNNDGTPKLDPNTGRPIPTYTNDEVMSMARAWTRFNRHPQRGNVEESSWTGNRIDPARIEAAWRDDFPKHDLTGGYIGDGYPLCVDLPAGMFLRRGARYRLLGASAVPELTRDPPQFAEFDANIARFELQEGSVLRDLLCNPDAAGSCRWRSSVTLETNLDCRSRECNVDTVRVVKIGAMHYEYVRPPCVEMAFYSGARKVTGRHSHEDAYCVNPLLPAASEACCASGSTAAAV